MKWFSVGALTAVLCSSSLHAGQLASSPAAEMALKDQLLARVQAFMHAWQKHDGAALTATLAREFVYVSQNGVTSREQVVGALTHACTLTSYSLSDVRVVPISADAAALVYKLHQTASCAGHTDPPVELNTDTLIRRDGNWLFLMTTSTLVPGEAAAAASPSVVR